MYSTLENFKLIGYTNSDNGGSIDDMKSKSGYTFHFGTSVVSLTSKKQPIVTLSSTKAEYIATCCMSSCMDAESVKRLVTEPSRTDNHLLRQ